MNTENTNADDGYITFGPRPTGCPLYIRQRGGRGLAERRLGGRAWEENGEAVIRLQVISGVDAEEQVEAEVVVLASEIVSLLDADAARKLAAAAAGRLAELAGEGMLVSDSHGNSDVPPGGAILHEDYDGRDHVTWWYPTPEAARAALVLWARKQGAVPYADGWRASGHDPGVSATVTRR